MPSRVSTVPLQKLADSKENDVAMAFIRSAESLREGVDLDALVKAIEANDLEAAVEACDVEEAAFSPVVTSLRAIYSEAGQLTASMIPPPPKARRNG